MYIIENIVKYVFPTVSYKDIDISFMNKVIDFNYRPTEHSWTGSMGESSHEFSLYGVDINKGIVHIPAKWGGKHGSNYAYVDTQEFEGDSILDALQRSGFSPSDFHFLIIEEYVYDGWEGSETSEYATAKVFLTK
jgi:hypothetical protein